MGIVAKLKTWLDVERSIRMIADDIHTKSELILLMRIIYANDVAAPEEIQCFKDICERAFRFPESDVAKIFDYIKEIGFVTPVSDVAASFQGLDMMRKQSLLNRMYDIAESDGVAKSRELDIIHDTAEVIGMNAHRIVLKAA